MLTFTADETHKNTRLDSTASCGFGISRAAACKLIDEQKLFVNGFEKPKSYRVCVGDVITAEECEPEEIDAQPQNIPLEIVYEDDDLLVVNKPQGMVVHPAAGNPDKTLVNALLFHCAGRLSSINGRIRPGIVHRLDKDTAGLLIVAKTDKAHINLASQIAEHSFARKYEAIVAGNFKVTEGTVDKPIGRHKTDRKKMAICETGRKAVTHFRVLKESNGFSHLELILETGRTHQIRVHMASLGHPVIGDPVYAPERLRFSQNGQCLFAKYIEFTHPITEERISFEVQRPEFFSEALKKFIGEE